MRSTHHPNLVSYSLLIFVVMVLGRHCTVDLDTHRCADNADCANGAYCDETGHCMLDVPESRSSADLTVALHDSSVEAHAHFELTGYYEAAIREGTGRVDVPEDDGENGAGDVATEPESPPSSNHDRQDEPAAQPDWADTLDGEHCAVPTPLTLGRNDIDTRPFHDDYSELDGACPGIQSRGPDMVGSITVPGRTRLELSMEAADFDAMVTVSRVCSFTELACIAGSFPGQTAPDFVNLTDADVDVFVIVDSRDAASGTAVLIAALSEIGTTDGDSLYSAVGVELGFLETIAFHADTVSYSNLYDDYSAVDGYLACCDDCSAPGTDAVFRIAAPDLPHDYFVRAGLDAEFDATLALTSGDSASPNACEHTQNSWVQHYQRDGEAAVSSYWLIVDGEDAESEGAFDIGLLVY